MHSIFVREVMPCTIIIYIYLLPTYRLYFKYTSSNESTITDQHGTFTISSRLNGTDSMLLSIMYSIKTYYEHIQYHIL